jgi:NAD(P)-dependent dehydrogenase (short-subunit alcohol dehydrogenase family)
MSSKVLLVTGGNRGIGYCIVQAICQRSPNHTVIVASRSKANAEKAISELKSEVSAVTFFPLALDITNDGSIEAAVEDVGKAFGKLDGRLEQHRDL